MAGKQCALVLMIHRQRYTSRGCQTNLKLAAQPIDTSMGGPAALMVTGSRGLANGYAVANTSAALHGLRCILPTGRLMSTTYTSPTTGREITATIVTRKQRVVTGRTDPHTGRYVRTDQIQTQYRVRLATAERIIGLAAQRFGSRSGAQAHIDYLAGRLTWTTAQG